MWGALRCTFFLRLTIYYVCTVVEVLLCLRINAFYVSVFDVSNVYVSFVFYAVNACVSFVFVDHQNCDWHSYRFEQAPESYRIKEFDPLPM